MLSFNWRKMDYLVICFVLLFSTIVPFDVRSAYAAGPASPVKVEKIDAGGLASMALKSDGTLVAWGRNDFGQLNVPLGLSEVVAIDVGYFHTLALKSDGTVVGWGNNSVGQLNVPAGLNDVVAIATGSNHSLALKSDNTLIGWGNNANGQTNVPVVVDGVVAIAAGNLHSLALKSDGTVVALGGDNVGQTNVPVGLDGVVAVAAGASHSLALKSDGTVVAWGGNNGGQTNVPVGLEGVVAIAAGEAHSLALKSDGTVVAWGENISGETDVPTDLEGVVAVAAGHLHSLALKSDGTLVTWGYNQDGQMNVPGNANLRDLKLEEGNFTESFDPAVMDYTYYYDGQSLSSVDVTPTLESTDQTVMYVNGELLPSGSTKTINFAGATTDTVIPVRVEPYLLPGKTYTITLAIDSTPPEVQFGTNGGVVAAKTAASIVTVSDLQSGIDDHSLQYVWTQSTAVPAMGWLPFSDGDTLSQTSGNGSWYLHIRAVDKVGNVKAAVSNPFLQDNTTPAPAPSPIDQGGSSPVGPSVTPSRSNQAVLAKINVYNSGKTLELSPKFTSGTTTYTVETDAAQVELEVASAHPKAVVKLLGERISEMTTVPLVMGANVLTLTVQAEDGTIKTYTVTINRMTHDEHHVPSAPVCRFTDIENHWATSDICEAAELGIVEGIDAYTFVPRGNVTRTEFAVMLMRTIQIPIRNESSEVSFSDAESIPAWAHLTIQTAVAEGILQGYPDGTLRPKQTVSRAEIATMVSKAMKWNADRTASSYFSDNTSIPTWAKAYVEAAQEHGLLKGQAGNRFVPEGRTTRAEAAVVLLRLWKSIH
ncbi:S-layer homology domain-containing protein [Paenibacillus amylolyticus]|uniref:S-layer homology domain-containing protein n=1 Tax=Paenibacillus amylolyticus TaxID=1451 RepID=A0ABD8AT68_PAEAM